jgi:hypothetical protein
VNYKVVPFMFTNFTIARQARASCRTRFLLFGVFRACLYRKQVALVKLLRAPLLVQPSLLLVLMLLLLLLYSLVPQHALKFAKDARQIL